MEAVTYASSILKRAVTLDTSKKYTESLVCYQEGIQILLEALKNISDVQQKEKIRAKCEEYMARAEKVKDHIESLKQLGDYREQLQIDEDSTGHSYDRIFTRFLDASVCRVEIDDPYIRSPHQCDNFLRLCELCVRLCPNLRVIFLKTGKDERNLVDQQQRLSNIAQSMRKHSSNAIQVQVDYSETLHDREIRLDNGWVIKIGRGLDYFKQVDRYTIGYHDYFFRPCRATIIDFFHKKELVRLKSNSK